jgi:hypothetical protein
VLPVASPPTGGSAWSARQLAAMADAKERAWRLAIDEVGREGAGSTSVQLLHKRPTASNWLLGPRAGLAPQHRCFARPHAPQGNPHLMPSFVAEAYAQLAVRPRGAPLDYARLRAIVAGAADPHDPGSAAWRARGAARKRRRAAAGAAASGGGGASGGAGARRRVHAARRGSSCGAAAGGAGLCGFDLSGGVAED